MRRPRRRLGLNNFTRPRELAPMSFATAARGNDRGSITRRPLIAAGAPLMGARDAHPHCDAARGEYFRDIRRACAVVQATSSIDRA